MRSTVKRPLPEFSSAIKLKDGTDSLPALFIFPGLGGTTDALRELCTSIVLPFRIYAFQPRGIDGKIPPDNRLEEIVYHYSAELTQLQPNGPYLLCGHSFGGLVAFEMARRLRAAGAEIAVLVLLDTPLNESFWPRSAFLYMLLQRLRYHLSVILALPLREVATYTARTAFKMIKTVLVYLRLAKKTISPDNELSSTLQEVWNCQILAAADYRPGFYPGKMFYFKAANSDGAIPDPNILWRGRVQELDVRVVPGGHRSMLDQPYVSGLALTLAECLRPFHAE